MNDREILNREREILKQVPKDNRMDFIERYWKPMRDLLWDEEWHSNLEIIDALLSGYKWL